MRAAENSLVHRLSPLTNAFLERSVASGASRRTLMRHHVETLRSVIGRTAPVRQFEPYMAARKITQVEWCNDLNCDGLIQPLGSGFADGFRLFLKCGMPTGRTRFTLAHEICHTFFYEVVPEFKFRPHETDPSEEALCNQGAAELLMPLSDVTRTASELPVCLQSLRQLGEIYGVSLETMLLRLRYLKLWQAEMSFWYRSSSGQFLLDRMYGARKARWYWTDDCILRDASKLPSSQIASGRTFVGFHHDDGFPRVKPVYYQLARQNDTLLAIWYATPFDHRPKDMPLFDSTADKTGTGPVTICRNPKRRSRKTSELGR